MVAHRRSKRASREGLAPLVLLIAARVGALNGAPGSSSLFPVGAGPAGGPAFRSQRAAPVGADEIPGLWRVFDQLAAVDAAADDASEVAPPECGLTAEQSRRLSATLLLAADGGALRSTTSAFATGRWRLVDAPIGPPALEVVLDNKPGSQRLLYRGIVLVDQDAAADLAAAETAAGSRLYGMPAQLGVYGSVDHLCTAPMPEGEGAEAAMAAETAASLAGAFTMRKEMGLGMPWPGGAVAYTCEVGESRGLA
ncbi:hypothetical protein KFE25_001501 [Diacronema lutheri]|uniref:Amine oxidase n=1 Tax=Diacronema lutheri TaxID=2081491 RepID=A0A8J5XBM4_DIALT|nr:hypothetical protein KFE25_001501 [Diacronema lutheri]